METRRPFRVFVTAIGVTLALAATAAGANLPIKGSYGNRDGCAYARSGESTGSEDFFLLQPDSLTTASSYCTFVSVKAKPNKGFAVSVQCEEEGSTDAQAPFAVDIEPRPSDSYVLKVDDGQVWGPLKLCR